MRSLASALRAARELGLTPLLLLGLHELRLRSGWLAYRAPRYDWEDQSLNSWLRPSIPSDPDAYAHYRRGSAPSFLFSAEQSFDDALQSWGGPEKAKALQEAHRILRGEFPFFGAIWLDLGFPPDWGAFPGIEGVHEAFRLPLDEHWTVFSRGDLPGDVKLIWEPSRFGWAFSLARAFRMTADPKFAEAFWELFDSWRIANLPNAGPHWNSAQEVAMRLMAIAFATYAFSQAWIQKPQRMAILAETIAVHADRLPLTLLYARAQRNNHLITEAVGLYTAGILFPELGAAEAWRKIGREALISSIRDQFFSDGGYIQYSTNYHRLALQASLWALRLAELNGDPFPLEVIDRLRKSVTYFNAIIDPQSGQTLNLGHNDGTLLLPLTGCALGDHRPTLQLASRMLEGRRRFGAGPWDELLLWFGYPPESGALGGVAAPPRIEAGTGENGAETAFEEAGLHLIRGRDTWGALRCGRFTSRPAHSDQLNLDLWWRGTYLARDAGTFLYDGPAPWDNAFSSALAHNTVVVDEEEPMERAGRFLWLDWSEGRILGRWSSPEGALEILAGEHDGYINRELMVRRTIVRVEDRQWFVIDELAGKGTHRLRSAWLLPDVTYTFIGDEVHLGLQSGSASVRFVTPGSKMALHRAGERIVGDATLGSRTGLLGWYSPTYALKSPALSLVGALEGELPLRLVTEWILGSSIAPRAEVEYRHDPGEGVSVSRVVYGNEILVV